MLIKHLDVTNIALTSLAHSGVPVPLDIGSVLTARLVRVGSQNTFYTRKQCTVRGIQLVKRGDPADLSIQDNKCYTPMHA